MSYGMTIGSFTLRLCSAAGLGALVGLERQWRQRFAGLRTNALVGAGACGFTLSAFLIEGDPSARGRVVSYVISGIGFLGAGVIFKEETNIRGLNTAATVWCSAAIGILTGLGASSYAGILASLILVVNVGLRPVSHWLSNHTADTSAEEFDSN